MPIKFELVECSHLTGNYYRPIDQPVKGAALLLHGSEGGGFGYHDVDAQILASHGIAALAFTWCGSPALPVNNVPNMVMNIELERTTRALQFLSDQPENCGLKLSICGVSRGAEQALILATLAARDSRIPSLSGVVALAASDTVVQAFSWDWKSAGGKKPDVPDAHAWLWQGREVSKIGDPIAVEKFDGAILLVHGEEDEIWSVERSRRLEARLTRFGRKVDALYLPGERHHLSNKGLHRYRSRMIAFLEECFQVHTVV